MGNFCTFLLSFIVNLKPLLKKKKTSPKNLTLRVDIFGKTCFTFMYVYILYMCVCLLDCDIKCIFFRSKKRNGYSRPSTCTGSTSAGSTNCKLKIFRNKNSTKFQEAKLEFATSPTMIYIAFALC